MLLKNTLVSPECLHTSRDLTNSGLWHVAQGWVWHQVVFSLDTLHGPRVELTMLLKNCYNSSEGLHTLAIVSLCLGWQWCGQVTWQDTEHGPWVWSSPCGLKHILDQLGFATSLSSLKHTASQCTGSQCGDWSLTGTQSPTKMQGGWLTVSFSTFIPTLLSNIDSGLNSGCVIVCPGPLELSGFVLV